MITSIIQHRQGIGKSKYCHLNKLFALFSFIRSIHFGTLLSQNTPSFLSLHSLNKALAKSFYPHPSVSQQCNSVITAFHYCSGQVIGNSWYYLSLVHFALFSFVPLQFIPLILRNNLAPLLSVPLIQQGSYSIITLSSRHGSCLVTTNTSQA